MIVSEVAKDERMEQIKEDRNGHPATAKQLPFLKGLGVEIPAGLSKKEASVLIDEELGKNGED